MRATKLLATPQDGLTGPVKNRHAPSIRRKELFSDRTTLIKHIPCRLTGKPLPAWLPLETTGLDQRIGIERKVSEQRIFDSHIQPAAPRRYVILRTPPISTLTCFIHEISLNN
jgi:hypothetical protein